MGLGDKVKSFDLFGQGIGFEIAGRGSLNSYIGAILSTAITAVTLFYGISRFNTMVERADTAY